MSPRFRLLRRPTVAVLLAVLPPVLCGPAVASSSATEADPREWLRGIDGMRRLPVTGLQMVRSGERTLFVSENGRFVFTGPAYDLWNRLRLASLEDAERASSRIDLSAMGLAVNELTPIDFGSGARDVVAFVDPRCPHCEALLAQMPGLAERYRFRLVLVPVLGRDSETLVRRLGCVAREAPERALQALLRHDYDALPAEPRPCDATGLQRALVVARLLGIEGVPYLIAPDGRVGRGSLPDLAGWLEAGS